MSAAEVVQLVDTHAHLDYDYPFSTEDYLRRAAAVGVHAIVSVGAARDNWSKVQGFANSFQGTDGLPSIYFSVGIHPHDASTFDGTIAEEMRLFAKDPRCVAIGEVGLDYHYDHSPRDIQKTACWDQLLLALDLKKPVIIHSRDGEEDLLTLLQEYTKRWRALDPDKRSAHPGVIHCFSGSMAFGRACLDLGFYLSFSGILTFKKAEEVREVALLTPLERLLVETDSPYLAPLPHRGKQNESAFVVETARRLADLKGLGLPELARATTANARALFGFTV
jgi:TatD DNase family protein